MQEDDFLKPNKSEVLSYKVPTQIYLKHKPRKNQVDALEFTTAAITNNKKYIMLDSPVGTGKSLYAMMVMDWYRQNYNELADFDIITNSKILQEQYTRDFEFINSLWGKDNYTCEQHNSTCSEGAEFNQLLGTQCEECPFKHAKQCFFGGEVSLTNFHMFLTYKLFLPFAWERKAKMLIIDEAHDFEAVFCDFISNKLSKQLLVRSGVDDMTADHIMSEATHNKNLDDSIDLIENDVIPTLKSTRSNLAYQLKKADKGAAKKIMSKITALDNNLTKFESCIKEYREDASNWSYEYSLNLRNEFEFNIQPVWAFPYLEKTIWKDYDHIIFMSGTILDRKLFSQLNGLDDTKAAYMAIPSPFPVANRPIFYINAGKMSYKTKVETFKEQVVFVDKILGKHKKDKGIIHTVNYELAGWINDRVKDNSRLLVHDSKSRQETLDRHYNTTVATVLVSPSMITGVDLREDFSRFQVILKMPYPNLQSEKVKRRNASIPEWYSWKTVCDLIQSYGRSIRSETDKADTYILDGCLDDVLRRGGKFVPQYIREAIVYVK